MKAVFDNLIQLEHLNIVKFHKYWADVKENRARVWKHVSTTFFKNHMDKMLVFILIVTYFWQVIFITEYMSSGSLKQFLKKTKKNHKTMNEKVWKVRLHRQMFKFLNFEIGFITRIKIQIPSNLFLFFF